MKLKRVRVLRFRCIHEQTVDFDDLTCIVGSNGSGKSTVLTALALFFRDPRSPAAALTNLSDADFYQRNVSEPIRIELTFGDLSPEALDVFKDYARQGELRVAAVATWDHAAKTASVKQFGVRPGIAEFSPFFAALGRKEKAVQLEEIYDGLRKAFPELPEKAKSTDARKSALREFEEKHPERCVPLDSGDEFYGFTGGRDKLERFIQWVHVPAVRDASGEQQESKNSALGILLERTIRQRLEITRKLEEVKAKATEEYRRVINENRSELQSLSDDVQQKLRDWTHGDARLHLAWSEDGSVSLADPKAQVSLGEGDFLGEIRRSGHGLQRSFVAVLLQELAARRDGGPTMLLAFEEPELYQHPPQIRHMVEVLEALATNGDQVILTTHSPYFVTGRGVDSVRVARRVPPWGACNIARTTLAEIEAEVASALGSTPGPPSSLMARLEHILQPSQSEVFFTPIAVIVEGLEDVAYLATQLRLKGKWAEFRRKGCHFVVAEGKTNMSRLVAIARQLGITFFAVFDGDGDEKDADKLRAAERDNLCLLNLCNAKGVPPLPTALVVGKNFAVWPATIGQAIGDELGLKDWQAAEEEVRKRLGFTDGVRRKNRLLITAVLEELKARGKSSGQLDSVIEEILKL